ncbi:hypothetical protein ZIOFF_026937 [Zingiber officinale]|uniref:ER membrane protein complex subunit 10 n=1 Tax=Zingiber officinale TaxID=94328 RepID=A0A8J5H0F8_ZINOF|nr:hypothetical protein ZIOFF_026937 [Zingiber officinale]
MQSSEMAKTNRRLLSLRFFLAFLSISFAAGFQSDELMQDDEEFGLEGGRPAADPQLYIPTQTPVRRRPELDLLAGSSDSKSIQFSLEHELGTPGFSPAGTFTARLKSWSHGGQTLTKLRFSRNALTEEEKKAFKKLLKEDGYYTIRVPSNVLDPPGRDFVVSSVRARCIPREILDEHFIIHADGVNILAVNYGSAEACQYPRLLRYRQKLADEEAAWAYPGKLRAVILYSTQLTAAGSHFVALSSIELWCLPSHKRQPAKWSFTSYTVMKTSEQAPRTPTFAEKLLAVEEGVGEGVKPPEKTFWAKYWMYLVPLVFIVLNAMTQAMNMPPEEGAAGQAAQLAPSANVRRR